MTFRHVTNLRTPLDGTDQAFLASMDRGQFKFGDPIPATDATNPLSLSQLKTMGIIGLYAKWEAFGPETMKLTGWGRIPLQTWNTYPEWQESDYNAQAMANRTNGVPDSLIEQPAVREA